MESEIFKTIEMVRRDSWPVIALTFFAGICVGVVLTVIMVELKF